MQFRTLNLALISAGLLSACGGGGSGTSTPPLPTTGTVTLTGVAARGAALAGASISAKCATGTGTATAGADGAYTLTLTDAALPCVLSASGDGLVLHSVATGSGAGAATANITPLTELLVAQLSGVAPASFAASASPAALAAIDSAAVATAQTAVVATLTRAGVDTTALGNLVTGTLVAASAGSAGNGYDQVLDALASALTSAGSTLAELTTTVATTATAVNAGSGSGTPGLPADLLLKPKAANCDALRSTRYHFVTLRPGAGSGALTGSFTVDASALSLTFADGGVDTWTASGNCTYTFSGTVGTQDEIRVSPSGIIVGRFYNDSTSSYNLALAVPAQTHALADLAGDWNALGWERNGVSYAVAHGNATLAANGAVTSAACFDTPISSTSCASETTLMPVLSVHPDGGFSMTSTDPAEPWTERWFAYRSGSGDLMIVALAQAGDDFYLWTPKRTLGLPSVGAVTSLWNFGLNTAAELPGGVGITTNTVSSVDSVGGSYARATSNEGSSVTVPQTLRANDSRSGYTRRVPATVTASDGSTATVREFYALGLRGMGLTPVFLPAAGASGAQYVLSINRP